MSRRIQGIAAVLGLAAGFPSPAWTQRLAAETTSASLLADPHLVALGLCAVVVAIVYCAMIHAIVKAPARGAYADGRKTAAEVMWTLAAAAILVTTAVPSTWGLLRQEGATVLTVQATGHGSGWHYAYPEHGVDFFSRPSPVATESMAPGSTAPGFTTPGSTTLGSTTLGSTAPGLTSAGAARGTWDNGSPVDVPLVVPVNAEVRLLLTAIDQIHQWWIPELDIKEDAVPGTVGVAGFFARRKGVYYGRCEDGVAPCTPIVVAVTSHDEYLQWLASRQDVLTRLD